MYDTIVLYIYGLPQLLHPIIIHIQDHMIVLYM